MTKCKKCKSENIVMVEYAYGSPERYDGVSEIMCQEPKCGARFGRWSKKELKEGEIEPRWGRQAPYVPNACACGELKDPQYPTCFTCFQKNPHES